MVQQQHVGSVTNRIYESMLEDIRSGILEPGAKLKVRELSARYEGSVGACREALNRLLGERFVESRGMTGFRVREISTVDFAEVHDLRDALEAHALRAAIANGDMAWEENIVVTFHRLTRFEGRGPDGDVTRETSHRDFHMALVDAGSSDWHKHYVRVLNLHGERYRRIILPDRILNPDYRSAVESEHEKLVELCLARKADEAVETLRNHRGRSRNELLDALSSM